MGIFGAILFQQTVKGKGISQAPKTDGEQGQRLARVLVVVGVCAAAAITYSQKHGGFGPGSRYKARRHNAIAPEVGLAMLQLFLQRPRFVPRAPAYRAGQLRLAVVYRAS